MGRTYQPNLRLKAWRNSKKLTQKEAGELAGISTNYYGKLESGQSIPNYVYERLHENGYNASADFGDFDPAVSPVFGPMSPVRIVTAAYFRNPADSNAVLEKTVAIPTTLAKLGSKAYIVPNDDDSMMPEYRPADALVFQLNPAMVAGFKYLFIDGESIIARKLVWQNDMWMLLTSNPDKSRYPDEPLGTRKIAALILGFYRKEVDLETVQASKDGMR